MKAGSYINDGKGNLTPNMDDETMAARQKKEDETKTTGASPTQEKIAVAEDAGSKKKGGSDK